MPLTPPLSTIKLLVQILKMNAVGPVADGNGTVLVFGVKTSGILCSEKGP